MLRNRVGPAYRSLKLSERRRRIVTRDRIGPIIERLGFHSIDAVVDAPHEQNIHVRTVPAGRLPSYDPRSDPIRCEKRIRIFSFAFCMEEAPSCAVRRLAKHGICTLMIGRRFAGRMNFADLQAALKTYQNGDSTAPLIWADVKPGTPNRFANFNELLWLILAFIGEPHTFSTPADCP